MSNFVSVRQEKPDEVIVAGPNGDALKVILNSNGTLEAVFLAKGQWALSGSNRTFDSDRRASVTGYNAVPSTDTKPVEPDYNRVYDKNYYANGRNGMTVADSSEWASDRVYFDIWEAYDESECGGWGDLIDVCKKLIYAGARRDKVYALAGRAKSVYKNLPYTSKGNTDLVTRLKAEAIADGYTI